MGKRHLLIETKTSFELVTEDGEELIESYPIQPYEHSVSCLGKIRAMQKIKELENLAWVDISDRIRKGKGR